MTVAELIRLLDHDGIDPNAKVVWLDHDLCVHQVEVVGDDGGEHIMLLEELTQTDLEMIRSKPR